MGQAVLEQRHLVSDWWAVSRFDHAYIGLGYMSQMVKNGRAYHIMVQFTDVKVGGLSRGSIMPLLD